MDEMLKKLINKAPNIISAAAQNPLGLASLCVLVLGVVGFLLFHDAAGGLKLLAFAMITGGFLGFLFTSNQKPPGQRMSEPHHDTPDRDDARSRGHQLADAAAVASGQRAAQARTTAPGTAVLITFPPALDSELSRFLLVHYRVPYEERRHVIIFSSFVTLWHGSSFRFPLLYGGSFPPLDQVRKMIDYFDPLCPADRNLLLTGPGRDSVEADWKAFNATLGTAVTAFAYFHLLPHREIMIRPLSGGTPDYEVLAVRWAYPLFAGFLRLALRLSASVAEEALGQIRTSVQNVDARLADGRQYLAGDRFSLSDMAFAVALAPLVLPDVYASLVPSFAEMPPVLRSAVAEIQSHPAGQFALRIYRDHRRGAPL